MEELILKERETKEKIVELFNNSNLPAFILKNILKEMLETTLTIEQQEYNMAKYNSVYKNKEKEEKK